MPGAALEFLEGSHTRVHVGDLPIFNLVRWNDPSAHVGVPPGIRAQVRRARNRGVTVCLLAEPLADPSSLLACRDEWLRSKPLPPMRFMTTPFLFDPWPEQGVFVAEHQGKIAGFLTSSQVLFGGVLRVDAVGRAPWAPNGCAELLVHEAFRRAVSFGIARATLGLAPLSRRSATRDSSAGWTTLARRLASPLYSFEGLEAFKAKFAPDTWIPLYAVAPGARFTPPDILAVARAFAGGSVLRYAARTAGWGE
jgi:lysylphosphatidylglycerol synthetase-like protein (DUF2156 family)